MRPIASKMRSHVCTVKENNTGTFDILCKSCGHVGIDQDYQGDAQAIADRHREFGGFEYTDPQTRSNLETNY